MKTPVETLREACQQLNAGKTGWKAADEPPVSEIFAPASHSQALDPDRALVVGNRGVGKSYWSGVLAHDASREAASRMFNRLNLDRCMVTLAFHESAADGLDEQAPSVERFNAFENKGVTPLQVWQGVVLATLRRQCDGANLGRAGTLEEAVHSVQTEPLGFERALREADKWFIAHGKKCLLVFDALDRLGTSWSVIRPRTMGLLRLALQLRSSKVLRCKIFMRPDQAADSRLFDFPDASKLLHESVSLQWNRPNLYGLLFHQLWSQKDTRKALHALVPDPRRLEVNPKLDLLPSALIGDEDAQMQVFYRLAGEFMGAGPTKGRTYSWLYDHLGDGAGEVSPRSFMAALVEAASMAPQNEKTPLSHKGLILGVQKASAVRLAQLKEDYAWVEETLKPLEGLQVPYAPDPFIQRWKERNTVHTILTLCKSSGRLPPISLADAPPDPEEKLLEELIKIQVMERRTNGKINIPDIFRVAAAIKRKGRIRPPLGKVAGLEPGIVRKS